MKKRITMKLLLFIPAILCLLLLAVYLNHQVQLKREEKLRLPLGQLVEVDGRRMSVYSEGSGDVTLVFLSGGGTCSPILDFRSLFTLLTEEYRIAVVEKFGYGFSEVVDKERDIDSVLADTRAALHAAGIRPPYILCPHSMSGLEALYWAQQYPGEVRAIVGLDMAVPAYYEQMKLSLPFLRAVSLAAKIGLTRLIPGGADGEAVRHGTLSASEKEIYRAVFHSRTATVSMINEVKAVRENARKVGAGAIPQVPMLLFVSNGSGGTGFEEDAWRKIPADYIKNARDAELIPLNCPHYVHDYEYKIISERIKAFLSRP